MRRSVRLLASVAFLVGIAACKKRCNPPKRVPPLCDFDIVSEQEAKAKALEPIIWLTLVSPTVNREAMTREGQLQSACGQLHPRLSADETFECPGFSVAAERTGVDRVEESDLIMSAAGDDRVLLWGATDELDNGEAEGTAALALWGGRGLEVHAVGVLRGYRQGARMKLHQIGKTPVMLLEADRCDSNGKCDRLTQVVPIVNRRLHEIPVWEQGRGCIGRAQFVLTKKAERPIEAGWTRKFTLTRTVELLEGQGVTITDLVNMEDVQKANPDAPTRPFRKITAKRPLELTPQLNRFLLRDEDLWERSLRDFGSAQIDPAKGG